MYGTMQKWNVNDQALKGACETLELKFPVRIRLLEDGPMGMMGKYHGLGHWGPTTDERLDEPHHHISLKADMSPEMANTALWHELTHAMQAERFLPIEANGDTPYRVANRGLAMGFRDEMKEVRQYYNSNSMLHYEDVSFEVEARSSEKLAKKNNLIDTQAKAKGNGKPSSKPKDPLRDSQGRATYRVDLWQDGKYDKKLKGRTAPTLIATEYCVAKDEFDAKKYVRDLYNAKWSGTTCEAYMILPRGGK